MKKMKPAPPTRKPPSPSRASQAERSRLVLQRTRLVACLGVISFGVWALTAWLFASVSVASHPVTRALEAVLCGAVFMLTALRQAERPATVLAGALVLGLTMIDRFMAGSGTDAGAIVHPMVTTMLVSALVFPWGVVAQAAVSSGLAASWLLLPDGSAFGPGVLEGAAFGLAASIGGAFLLDRQQGVIEHERRSRSLERERAADAARQSQVLLDVSREINSTVDLAKLVNLVTRLGQRLLPCDVVTLSVPDKRRQIFRTIAVSAESPETREVFRTFEVPGDPSVTAELARRRVVIVPSASDAGPLGRLGAPFGVERTLLAAILRDDRLLGVLSFLRRSGHAAYDEASVHLAEGIAHQAAIALANARLFEELRSAGQVKSVFLSTMSHELRTPINVIIGLTDMARDRDVPASERAECLTKIDRAARDLLELVETTLSIGRMEAGRDEARPEPVSLPAFWHDLGQFCMRLPRKPEVALDWDGGVPGALVVTDPRKLTVVLRNLVGNALKFTEHGRVRVWSFLKGRRLVFAVSDTGIGIRREEQATIFEMFRQADGSDARRFGGTGLGLYIVSQYVQQLGGTIEVESAPGHGSTFFVALPLRLAEESRTDVAAA